MRTQIGRLAMRVEGSDWVAYYAKADTMEGALVLGSVKMAVVQDKDRKRAFVELMKSYVGDVLAAGYGEQPNWTEPTPAPESERSGTA